MAPIDAVVRAGRVVSEVAAGHNLSRWTVQRTALAAAVLLTDPDTVPVRRLGMDEHRYRSVRYYGDTAGGWRRFEPWMTTIVDADAGRASVWTTVTPRASAAGSLSAPRPGATVPRSWRSTCRRRSAARYDNSCHARALGRCIPPGQARQRPAHPGPAARHPGGEGPPRQAGRPGLGEPPTATSSRRHPLRGGADSAEGDTGRGRPDERDRRAWAFKKWLRQLLQADTLEQAEQRRTVLVDAVALAAMPETDRVLATVQAWWPAIEVLVVTGVINARTEAANTSIKQIKRSGRGYHYKARFLLASAAGRAA